MNDLRLPAYTNNMTLTQYLKYHVDNMEERDNIYLFTTYQRGCLGGAMVRRRTRDRKVAGSTPGRGAIKSNRSTQLSIPLG